MEEALQRVRWDRLLGADCYRAFMTAVVGERLHSACLSIFPVATSFDTAARRMSRPPAYGCARVLGSLAAGF